MTHLHERGVVEVAGRIRRREDLAWAAELGLIGSTRHG
jgi:hypothetical protein